METKPKEKKLLDGTRILIVEDEPDSREVLQLFLEQNGAEVKSAELRQEALTYLKGLDDNLPDIILSDLAMPGMRRIFLMLNEIRKFPPKKAEKFRQSLLAHSPQWTTNKKLLNRVFRNITQNLLSRME